MKYGHIAHLDKPVSKLIVGCMGADEGDMEAAFTRLDAFFAEGVNTIDMATIYGGGSGQRAVGRWMQARGNRDQVVLFDKGCHHGSEGRRVQPDDLTTDLHINLERLQTDHVDVFTFHRDDPSVPVGALAERMTRHWEEGKVKAYGASNWHHTRIQELNDYASSHGLRGFSLDNPNLSLATVNEPMWWEAYTITLEGRRWHEETQFPLFSWSSQGGGYFAGRESDDIRRVYFNDENRRRKEWLESMAREKGVDPVALALAWTLNQPYPVWALVGPRNLDELRSSMAAFEIDLSSAELRRLEHGD